LEATSVTDEHLARPDCLVLNKKNLDGFKRLVDTFKTTDSEALLIVQLTHSGRQSGSFSRKVKIYDDEEKGIPVLSEEELEEVLKLHLDAADLAKEAGFDGVDVKTCHGYLGTELLRPLNQRNDKFGGSVENRAYLIASTIQTAVDNFPGLVVGTRISAYEGLRGGCGTASPAEIVENLEDIRKIAAIFVDSGAQFLNISGGAPGVNSQLIGPSKKDVFCRLSHFRYAKQFKTWFPNTAVIGSAYTYGDTSSLDYAEDNIARGYTDFAGFGRQNLADERFPRKASEDGGSVRYCTLCGRCSKLLSGNEKVYCSYHNPTNPYV
jgi:2,4-dienoyl-CoA reductase-like NADH-dependent reductase (Old Yellow Enzyme family)